MFLFLKNIFSDNYPPPPLPLYDSSTLPPIYTYPSLISGKLTWPQKILEVSSDSAPQTSGNIAAQKNLQFDCLHILGNHMNHMSFSSCKWKK